MSLDKSAIQHIQESWGLEEANKQLSNTKTKTPVVAIPQGLSIESLEQYMPLASSYRFVFTTSSIDDFIRYNLLNDKKGAFCFVNDETMEAVSIFDLGSVEKPGHKRSKAILELKETALFARLVEINGQHMDQKSAAEFIEDWGDSIESIITKKGEQATASAAAMMLSKMTISSVKDITSHVGDFNESLSSMERIEAKGEDDIPSVFTFKCIPYVGLPERSLTLKVGIITTGEKPKVSLRIVRFDQLSEDIAEEFKKVIVDQTNDLEIETLIGKAGSRHT